MNPFAIAKQFIEIISWPIKIQNDYFTKLLNTYYEHKPEKDDNRTEEADKVSARIAAISTLLPK